MADVRGANYKNITGTNLTKTGSGQVFGFIINSNTAGTIKIWDNKDGNASGPVIMDTYTLVAGSSTISFPEPINYYYGLTIAVGGTLNATVLYN